MLYLHRANRIEDFEPFYELKCQRDAIAWSGFDNAPDKENLRKYFIDKIVNNSNTFVYYLLDSEIPDEICMGYEQFDLDDNGLVEMRGTVIKRKYQGLGYYDDLRVLIEKEIRNLHGKKIESWCSEKNVASMDGSEGMGWLKTNEYQIVNLPKLGGEHKFYKWVRVL